ncbi:hypothetical protein E2C01_093916 [Portunus trituberculatus]|uniref:Uncharacterized protein n=1 Tax=Portunus trituberculatus TaxID=210409 RepID=A0A5B7JR42_PORTR|nr:hypothetical protein [Portunus trituberculatus]
MHIQEILSPQTAQILQNRPKATHEKSPQNRESSIVLPSLNAAECRNCLRVKGKNPTASLGHENAGKAACWEGERERD